MRISSICSPKIVGLWTALLLSGLVSAQPAGSITQGRGTTTIANMIPGCTSNHITPFGTIVSTDGVTWEVPASINYYTGQHLADLYNTCTGTTPANLAAANLSNVPIQVVDPAGDTIIGYLFCDNYFELFINGQLIGVDPLPFTPFNSCVVKFVVSRPYTIAVKLVDWEENLGLGSEIQQTDSFHPGDGGFIAQFSDGTVTDSTWKTQCFYIAPLQDVNDVHELPDGTHSTATATVAPGCQSNCFGAHYPIDSNWTAPSFNDSGWPDAHLYLASQVTNQAAYVNFATTAWGNARFIWSSNLILDNLVLTRKTVSPVISSSGSGTKTLPFTASLHGDRISIMCDKDYPNADVVLFDSVGRKVEEWDNQHLMRGNVTSLIRKNTTVNDQWFILRVTQGPESFTQKIIQSEK